MGTLLLVVALSAAPAGARCRAGAEEAEGLRRWSQLEAAVKAGGVREAWAAVAAHACFVPLLAENRREPPLDDAEAFGAWWARGGGDWLSSALPSHGLADRTVLPPDPPVVVKHGDEGGLTWLRCAEDAPPTCDRDAAGWTLRLKRSLRSPEPDVAAVVTGCEGAARKAKKSAAYVAWRSCLEEKRPLSAAMPLGRYRAPREGWWVLRGRRGHYAFCDEVRAYELSTGAAWVAQSCSRLALQRSGQVDVERTDAERSVTVRSGRLPVEALREAAWMTLLARHIEPQVQTDAWFVPRPAWLTPRWPEGAEVSVGGLGHRGWFSSGQTLLAWSWQGAEGLRDAGALTWPASSSPGEDHAAALWAIAEAAFEAGEAPGRPPWPLRTSGKPGVSKVDAAPGALDAVEARLLEALHDATTR